MLNKLSLWLALYFCTAKILTSSAFADARIIDCTKHSIVDSGQTTKAYEKWHKFQLANNNETTELLMERLQSAQKKHKATDEADTLYDLAVSYFKRKDLPQAEKYMQQAIEKDCMLKRHDETIRDSIALAQILLTVKRKDEALSVYKQALELVSQNHNDQLQARLLNDMGAIYLSSDQLEQAYELLCQGRNLARKSNSPTTEANALTNLASIARKRNQLQLAENHLSHAITLLQEEGDERSLAEALKQQGSTKADLGLLDDARKSYQQAAELYLTEQDLQSRAQVLFFLGQILQKQNKNKDALTALQEASAYFKANNKWTEEFDCLLSIGSQFSEIGQFDKAENTFKEAYAINDKFAPGNYANKRKLLSELGYSLLLSGAPEKALNSYLEAYTLLSENDASDIKSRAVLLADIAMCYKALGQSAAAIRYYQQAINDLRNCHDDHDLALAINSLAVAYLDNGMHKEFEQYANEAKGLFIALNDIGGQGLVAYNAGQYALFQEHYAEAVPLFEEALKYMQEIGDKKAEGQSLRGLGLAYLCLGRAAKSLEFYQQASQQAESSQSIESKWDCAIGMGKAYKALGETNKAIDQFFLAADLVEKERRQLSKDTFKTFNMDLRSDCFIELVDTLVKSNRINEALVVAERGRARAFLDMLEGRHTCGITHTQIGNLNPFEKSLSVAKDFDASQVKHLVESEKGTRAVEIIPHASTIVEASAISPINALPPTLAEIIALVKESGSTILEYYVLPDKVLIWIVHPNGTIELAPPVLISHQQLDEMVAKTYRSIVTHPKSPAEVLTLNKERETNLQDLYRLLVEDALKYLPAKCDETITVVPYGSLFSVPFAALLNSNKRFFIEDHTLNYIPAIGVLRATQQLEKESSKTEKHLLAFGNPITKSISFLGVLPYAESEVKHVAELFGPNHSTLEIGAKANKSTFLKLAPEASVIHLATHGLIDEQHPMESSLVLAPEASDDGLLSVKEILQLPTLKANLIVLSACQTGRGKITGDGVVGLSRAFIIAGSPSVLVSQWNVDDAMTEYQMVAFYKSLLKNIDKAKSLREAQLRTINLLERPSLKETTTNTPKDLRRANPRYWAAFQLIGNHI